MHNIRECVRLQAATATELDKLSGDKLCQSWINA